MKKLLDKMIKRNFCFIVNVEDFGDILKNLKSIGLGNAITSTGHCGWVNEDEKWFIDVKCTTELCDKIDETLSNNGFELKMKELKRIYVSKR